MITINTTEPLSQKIIMEAFNYVGGCVFIFTGQYALCRIMQELVYGSESVKVIYNVLYDEVNPGRWSIIGVNNKGESKTYYSLGDGSDIIK